MTTLLQDVKYGLRLLGRSPAFAAVAVLTLALGIGANTAIFSLLDALFLMPLPVPNASQLVDVYKTRNGRGYGELSYPDYVFYRDRSDAFSALAAEYPTAPINLVISGESQELNGSVVSQNYFHVLELSPFLGRFFVREEDQAPGRNPVAVISYALWQRRFGGDAGILGKTVQLNGTVFTIVGVAPKGFQGAILGLPATDVWIPAAMFHAGYHYCDAFQRDCTVLNLVGRLKQGVTPARAQAEMSGLARQLEAAFPETNRGIGVAVVPARGVRPVERAESAPAAALLFGAVGLVLLIACANLAGLLLVRNTARRREIALRLALGAGRGRLVRQLVTEGLLLSVAGGLAGLWVALQGQNLLLNFYATASEGGQTYFTLRLDPRVLGFALALSILTGVLFSVIPGVQASRANLTDAMKDAGLATGRHRSRLRDVLVVGQVALSLVLVTGAGLLLRSLGNIYRGPGYDVAHLAWLRLRPSLIGYPAAKAWAYQREVIRRLEALPGVVAASPEDYSPLRNSGDDVSIWLPGKAPTRPELAARAGINQVGPRTFETLGVPLLQGREFNQQDRKDTPSVAIVNETLADRMWSPGKAVGSILVVEGQPYRVIGTVKDAQYHAMSERPAAFVYVDYWQQDTSTSWGEDSRTMVRMAGDPRAMLPLLRRTAASVDPNVPISEDRPMREWLADEFSPVRMAGTSLVCFAGLALLLSAIGLYGILAFTVSQRTREIAVRMALGAGRSGVAKQVVRRGALLGLTGTAIGLAAALAGGRLVASWLYGVRGYDPIALLAGPVLLIGVALVASYLPARRASSVDPAAALRFE
ncbi:MAG TPA: ABC transporter permease [Candidatus Acidoferrales bacterium]|nr:ABC transporter permease [Candidatus Acidoferrales bacterium]